MWELQPFLNNHDFVVNEDSSKHSLNHHLQLQGACWSCRLLALEESPDLLEATALADKDDKHGDAAKEVDRVDGDSDVGADVAAQTLAPQQLAERFKAPREAQD